MSRLLLIVVTATLAFVLACNGCRSSQTPTTATSASAEAASPDPGPPTVRLYLLTDVAGVFEPCGCTKDQLGGVDHVAAWMAAEKAKAPVSALVAAGPLFFMEPALKPERAEQDQTKAETIARSLKALGFAAFAPGDNDWAAGRDRLGALAQTSGGASLYAGSGANGVVVRDIGGVKIGFIGVGSPPPATASGDAGARDAAAATERPKAADAVRAGIAEAKKQGADVLIALVAVGRGEAKRIADVAPELTAIVVGSQAQSGEANTTASPAERVGNVIIAEAANHMQSVAVLDLFVRDRSFSFADASGIEQARKRDELTRRIDDLRVKIANWERDGKVARADIEARRADVVRLERERDALDTRPPPTSGSFFRYTVKEIRDALGKDDAVGAEMLAYYKKVNDRNKVLFADRAPRSAAADQAKYVGVAVCASCHESAKKFWDTTKHANAYATLSTQYKEFNLDCVSCHVTGYEQPGGSTVTHVDKLKDVQCETCHGPGSKHVANPKDQSLLVAHPKPDLCIGCHHPPHVEQFDSTLKMAEILGPGHGRSK